MTRNVDLAAMGASPGPVYSKLWATFGVVEATVFGDGQTDHGTIEVFGESNGGGSKIAGGILKDDMYFNAWGDTDAEFVDGVFSIVYASTAGDFTVEDSRFYTQLCDNAGGCTLVEISFPAEGGAVPEPATLGLVCFGLAGLAVARRRKDSILHARN